EGIVARRPGAMDRPRMRRVTEKRANRHDDLATRRPSHGDHVIAELAPPEVGFDTEHEYDVAIGHRHRAGGERERRPRNGTDDAFDELDRRSRRLEVDVLLDVERRERTA